MAVLPLDQVKVGYEFYLYSSFNPMLFINRVELTAPSTGNQYNSVNDPEGHLVAFPAAAGGPYQVYARVKRVPIGTSSIVITASDGANAGYATLAAYDQADWAVPITNDYGTNLLLNGALTITFTGGTAGEIFDLFILPTGTPYTSPYGGYIGFSQDFTYDPGTTSKSIPHHYDPKDHKKLIRGDYTFAITEWYRNFKDSMNWIRDRDVTLQVQVRPNGQATPVEYIYLHEASIMTLPTASGTDDAESTVSGDGAYAQAAIIQP